MKTLGIMLIGMALLSFSAKAQVSVGLNVNIGAPPAWAPPAPVEVRYYYLPEIRTYYDVQTRHYIYMDRGRWSRRAHLPVAYRGYNLYDGPKVVVENYYGAAPYTYYKPVKVKHHPKHYKHKHHKHHGRHHRDRD